MTIYQEIYAPVEKGIDALLGELEDRVVFDAEIQLTEYDFVEKVPYPETQAYVKKVLRSYWCYSNIY